MLGAIGIVVVLTGCGSDSSGDTTAPTVSIPAVTSPLGTTSTPPARTTVPTSTSTTSATSTRKRGNYNPKLPDSATNDVPPPAGSPQSAFEKQCEKNPQACG